MSTPLLRTLDTRHVDFESGFARLERRRSIASREVDESVAAILADVRARGDAAVIDATRRFDGFEATPETLELTADEIEKGREPLGAAARDALRTAAARIEAFHARRVPESWLESDDGAELGQLVRPIQRVAIYVPAWKAPLASTVLMLGVPARVARVPELVLTTSSEHPHPAILEAARLAGVSRVFRIGGAQAIGALAYGTRRVPRVDKIVGPGNSYVQAAKRLVFGEVAIDAEAGPSEVMIVADASADPGYLAADLLAQAEHDEAASVVLATPSGELIDATLRELAARLPSLPRADIARRCLAGASAAILTRDVDEALVLANRYAAEHLQLMLRDARDRLGAVENAGAVFLGPYTPVPMGDYVAGPSHVLPTGGTARFFSVLGVEDFLRRMSVVEFSREGIRRVGPAAVQLAELEGLDAHARAVQARLGTEEGEG